MQHELSAEEARLAYLLFLWVPEASSTSCDQVIFVDQTSDASLSSDAVLLKIDRFRKWLQRGSAVQ